MKTLSMLSLDETKSLMSETVFSTMEKASFDKLYPLFERKQVGRGELIRKAGEESGDLYIVESGRFVLTASDHSVLASYARPDSIGLMSVLLPGKQLLDTSAAEDSVVLHLDSGSIKMVEYSDPALSIQLLRCIRQAVSPRVNQALQLMQHLYQT